MRVQNPLRVTAPDQQRQLDEHHPVPIQRVATGPRRAHPARRSTPVLASPVVGAALSPLAHLHLSHWLLRLVVFAGLSGVTGLWGARMAVGRFVGADVAAAGDGREPLRADRSGALCRRDAIGHVHLAAGRPRACSSARTRFGVIGSSGSGAPTVDVRCTAPGRLVVTYQEEVVSRIRFDPYELGVTAAETVEGAPALVRYADDLVALCHSRDQALQVKERLAAWLAPRGLAFNEAKTRIVTVEAGFDFLVATRGRTVRVGSLMGGSGV